jgi:hypothetical protein
MNILAKRTITRIMVLSLLISPLLFEQGCASVPKESVELSYTLGNDLEALHQSYRTLIARYFESLRREVNSAIDQIFIPAYINDFVITGKLVENAKAGRSDLVEAWARIAVETIDKERATRIAPIDKAEKDLLVSVNDAFDKAIRANAAVTAQLNSIRKVEEVQGEILESLKLKDIRNKINDALADASKKAKEITDEIDKAAGKLKKDASLKK